MTDRYGDWLQTATGRCFWPLDPRPEDIYIEDISLALAKICRFGGHCLVPYYVGQHCVVGSLIVQNLTQDPGLALAFLLHDATEAYLGDVIRPLKVMPEFEVYRKIESRLAKVIADKYSVNFDHPLIHSVDKIMLNTERRDLLTPGPWVQSPDVANLTITPWDWVRTHRTYMARFEFLMRSREGARL